MLMTQKKESLNFPFFVMHRGVEREIVSKLTDTSRTRRRLSEVSSLLLDCFILLSIPQIFRVQLLFYPHGKRFHRKREVHCRCHPLQL